MDSVSTKWRFEKVISLNDYNLLGTEQIWQQPSQSEMKNGGSYGCLDGYALLIEMNNKSKYKFLSYICPDLHISKDTTFETIQVFVKKVGKLIRQND